MAKQPPRPVKPIKKKANQLKAAGVEQVDYKPVA